MAVKTIVHYFVVIPEFGVKLIYLFDKCKYLAFLSKLALDVNSRGTICSLILSYSIASHGMLTANELH